MGWLSFLHGVQEGIYTVNRDIGRGRRFFKQQIFVNLSTKLSTFVPLYNFLLWSRL